MIEVKVASRLDTPLVREGGHKEASYHARGGGSYTIQRNSDGNRITILFYSETAAVEIFFDANKDVNAAAQFASDMARAVGRRTAREVS